MTELIMSWPWYDRAIAGVVFAAVVLVPLRIGAQLEHLSKQQARIIDLLIDIKISRREL